MKTKFTIVRSWLLTRADGGCSLLPSLRPDNYMGQGYLISGRQAVAAGLITEIDGRDTLDRARATR